MEYKKGKEEEKRVKNTPPAASTRSSRSTTKRTEEGIKEDSTQRSLRSMMQASAKKMTTTSTTTTATRTTSATSSSTTLTESITTIDTIDKNESKANQDELDEQDEQDGEPETQDDDDTLINRDAQVQTDHIQIVLEKCEVVTVESSVEQQTEQKSDDAGEDSVVPIQEGSPRRPVVRKEVVKPVAKDTVHEDEEEDEDNIHPLARTVVKSTTRLIHRKPHMDDTSNHDSTDKAHQPINIPSKSPRKIVVQESNMPETVLPLPSHMNAMFELFKGLEQVLEFTKRQGQLCFYHKLRKHVELQSGR